jgi:hypothetical protein
MNVLSSRYWMKRQLFDCKERKKGEKNFLSYPAVAASARHPDILTTYSGKLK